MDIQSAVERFGDMVTRLSCVNLRCLCDAEDAFQNVFLKLHTHPAILEKPPDEVKRWLVTVTVNECKDQNRRLFHRDHDAWEELSAACEQDFDRNVLHAVRSLPPKYARVIYLHYYEGYSVRELAMMLKSKENTIKSQLLRGRELLKGELSDGTE